VFSGFPGLEDMFTAQCFLAEEPLTSIKNKSPGSNLTRKPKKIPYFLLMSILLLSDYHRQLSWDDPGATLVVVDRLRNQVI
jgi:hypothetical protein